MISSGLRSPRGFLPIAGACLLLAGMSPVRADTYPSRTITIITPFAAGSVTDATARMIGQYLQDALGQSVIIENRAGAGGLPAANVVARAKPDGYTLFLTTNSTHSAANGLFKNVPYDPIKDFTPIARIGSFPSFVAVNPSMPAKSMAELVAYAKANPGKLSAGTPGIGSPHHLAAAMLNSGAKIDITHVPYRGTAPALNDLLGGQIPLIWATPNAVIQFVEAGKVKALATASPQRIALLPQVPTIAESALPGFGVGVWFGIAAPARTPRETVERLTKEIGEITKLPDVQKRLSPVGYDLDFAGSEALRDLIASDHKRYGTVIRDAGIAPN
jgi:tripartite-type tricarboxylate transporter receptor subunit TctC